MSNSAREKLLGVGLALTVLGILSVAVLQLSIGWTARQAGERARRQFRGDRVEALVQLVDCTGCRLEDRSEAVWALGVLEDPRALAVLRKYHSGKECRHGVELCQYELGKAIKKIEGTWNLRSSLRTLFEKFAHVPGERKTVSNQPSAISQTGSALQNPPRPRSPAPATIPPA